MKIVYYRFLFKIHYFVYLIFIFLYFFFGHSEDEIIYKSTFFLHVHNFCIPLQHKIFFFKWREHLFFSFILFKIPYLMVIVIENFLIQCKAESKSWWTIKIWNKRTSVVREQRFFFPMSVRKSKYRLFLSLFNLYFINIQSGPSAIYHQIVAPTL